ncbi:hypothetical protein ACFYOI_05900 [Streptomyces microflavus]|uniref:hypothetical protein n=1 Tax=Streptomyces microflavus TaxID=1919 RepID=UPI0033ADD361
MSTEASPPGSRTRGLRQASAKKAALARQAAEIGLAAVVNSGREVNFSAVARESGVSANYLRKQADLAAQIFKLRHAGRTKASPQGDLENSESIAALSTSLARGAECSEELIELRARNKELETLLDSANAEIARLSILVKQFSHVQRQAEALSSDAIN